MIPTTIELRWNEDPSWSPVSDRWWKLRTPLFIVERKTTAGVERLALREGLHTDFRSGGWGVDPIVPWAANTPSLVKWTCHDVGYHGFFPRTWADEWLRQDCVAMGDPAWRTAITYRAVRIFGGLNYTADPELLERKYKANLPYISHTTNDRFSLDITCPRISYPHST